MLRGFRIFLPLPLTRVMSSPCSTTTSLSPGKNSGEMIVTHVKNYYTLSCNESWVDLEIEEAGYDGFITRVNGNGWEATTSKPHLFIGSFQQVTAVNSGTTQFRINWIILYDGGGLPVSVWVPACWPALPVRARRDTVSVETVAPTAEFAMMNKWSGACASSSPCCWPEWFRHFQLTPWSQVLKMCRPKNQHDIILSLHNILSIW